MDDKKELILHEARRLFLHYGYKKTSMEDIANAAGIGKASIYYYFKSKDDILCELHDKEHNKLMLEIEEKLKKVDKAADKLEIFLMEPYRIIFVEKGVIALTFELMNLNKTEIILMNEKFNKDYMNRILRIINEGIEKEEFTKQENIEEICTSIINYFEANDFLELYKMKNFDEDRFLQNIDKILISRQVMVKLIINGLKYKQN